MYYFFLKLKGNHKDFLMLNAPSIISHMLFANHMFIISDNCKSTIPTIRQGSRQQPSDFSISIFQN
jgi:hypothetical protein